MSAPKRKSCAEMERERIVDRLLEAASEAMRMALAAGRPATLAHGLFEACFYVVDDVDLARHWPMASEWESWWREALGIGRAESGGYDWHRCKACLKKVYAPETRCPCGGELHGVTYAKTAA